MGKRKEPKSGSERNPGGGEEREKKIIIWQYR